MSRTIQGATCTAFDVTIGSWVTLSFHSAEGDALLEILSSWRLERNGEILFGSLDCVLAQERSDEQIWIEMAGLVRGSTVAEIRFGTPIGDLILQFENGITLKTFTDDPQCESWYLGTRACRGLRMDSHGNVVEWND